MSRPRKLSQAEAKRLDRLGYKIVGFRLTKPRKRGGVPTIVLTVALPR
jgi:hypothetical protein